MTHVSIPIPALSVRLLFIFLFLDADPKEVLCLEQSTASYT